MKRPPKGSLDKMKKLFKNNFSNFDDYVMVLGYNCNSKYQNRRKLREFIERNSAFIKEIKGRYYPTEHAREFLNDFFYDSQSDDLIEFHAICYEFLPEEKLNIQTLERVAEFYDLQYNLSLRGRRLSIHDTDLNITFEYLANDKIFIGLKEPVQGHSSTACMDKIQETYNTLIPKLMKKYSFKLKDPFKPDCEFKLDYARLQNRHIALIHHPLDTWLRDRNIKVRIIDAKTNKPRLVLDKSKGFHHLESETPEDSLKTVNKVNELYMDILNGESIKENRLAIDELKFKLENMGGASEDEINDIMQQLAKQKTINDGQNFFNYELLKMHKELTKTNIVQNQLLSEMKDDFYRLRNLKFAIRSKEDIPKYQSDIDLLHDFEKRELYEHIGRL